MKAKIFALVALVLGMVSCQKEINGIAVDKNGEAAVTISVALPEEGATRAGGADSAVGAIGNIDLAQYDIRYVLAVYDANGTLAKGPFTNYEDNSTSTSFTLRLVPGRDYKFVVWADFTAQGVKESLHYDTSNLAEVKLKGNMDEHKLMDETRDAYTGVSYVETFSSTSDVNVLLTRPFAKLRVVTTDMNEIYSNLKNAVVTYTTPINTTFNAIAGVKGDTYENVAKTVYYGNSRYYSNEDGKSQMTLFADYLFGTEDGTVQFTLDVADAVAAIPQVIFNTNIPVQRNYLTTVTGPILTDSNNITVTIEEGFAGYHDVFVKVASAEELANAIENAEDGVETVIEITDNIDITDLFAGLLSTRANKFEAAITIPASKNICLNIADKNVTYSSDYMNGAMIQNNGKLTIKGTTGSLIYTYEGEADTTNSYGNYAIYNAGELNIDANISIVASKAVEGQKFSHALYVVHNSNGGKVNFDGGLVYNKFGYAVREFGDGDLTVNGGEIKGTRAIWLQLPSSNPSLAPAINLTVNGGKLTSTGESGGYKLAVYSYNYGSKLNNVNIVVNDGDFDGDIALTGGTNKAEVENVTIYGGHIRDIYSYGNEAAAKESIVIYGGSFENDPSAYVAYGYAAVNANNVWTVEKCVDVVGDKYEIYSAAGLKWLADEVNSGRDTFEGKNVVLTADIDLAGYNWTPIGNATNDFIGNFDGNGKVVKNLTITNPALDEDGYAYAGLFGVTEYNTIKNLTIENVNISTEGHIVAAAIAYPYYTVVENVTVKGDIQIDGRNYVAGVLGYTRRCVNAKNLVVEANANSSITGDSTIGGVLSDLQMNGGLKADYSNFKASGLTINGNQLVGGISGIISGQTLHGATVENVTICCSDARKGQIAGAVGEESFITEANVKNVTGAENLVGATYKSGETGKVTINGAVYEYLADGTITMNGALVVADGVVIDAEGAYCISNKAGMFWFANEVNVNKNAFKGKTVKLAADIDLNNAAWTPIGQTGVKTFEGVFDGQNHTIYNLNVNSTAQTGANYSSGLFGWVETHSEGNGILKNVKIENAVVKGNHNCGALVGYITEKFAIVDNCHVSNAAIECHVANSDANGDKAGALIGNATNATKVNNCSAANSTVSAGRDAGQLIGVAKLDNVTNCSATNVSVSANGEGTGANINNDVVGRKL